MQLQNINEKRLRKVYSRLILQAMREGTATRRNISIIYDGYLFMFAFRGTLILAWDVEKDKVSDIYAGDYEDAPSTIYQRTRLREAIHELRMAVKAEAV